MSGADSKSPRPASKAAAKAIAKAGARRPGDLRAALIAETVKLIEHEDMAAISLREVARRAGVSPGAPYHHFADRGDLLAAVAEQGFAALGERQAAALTAVWSAAPLVRLQAMSIAYLRFAIEHRAHYRVMFLPELASATHLAGLQQVALGSMMRLVDVVHALRPESRRESAMLAAVAGWSLAHGFVLLWNDGLLAAMPGMVGQEAVLLATGRSVALAAQAALLDAAAPLPAAAAAIPQSRVRRQSVRSKR
jgi:AcrR family transcriptional regulator